MSQLSGVKGFGHRLAQERRLKSARDHRDIEKQDVAKAIGVSNSTYGRWESGTVPDAETVERLAKYFEVRVAWLHYGDGERQAVKTKPATPQLTETREVKTVDPRAGQRGSAAPRRVVGRRHPDK